MSLQLKMGEAISSNKIKIPAHNVLKVLYIYIYIRLLVSSDNKCKFNRSHAPIHTTLNCKIFKLWFRHYLKIYLYIFLLHETFVPVRIGNNIIISLKLMVH